MRLAYECSCHINPPCSNCENACALCEGTGMITICRNARGEVDYLNGTPTGETGTCDVCGGEGTL